MFKTQDFCIENMGFVVSIKYDFINYRNLIINVAIWCSAFNATGKVYFVFRGCRQTRKKRKD